ncbi:MAG TPA: hypothetical protein VE225_01750 [Rubrobacteraceae bacterium]|nr:hypothetical protein [Rubrobacteraceae bacterium]
MAGLPANHTAKSASPSEIIVREHVPRVGQERQGAGDEAADDLGDREGGGEGEHDRQGPPVRPIVVVLVTSGFVRVPLISLEMRHGRVYAFSYCLRASQTPEPTWTRPRRRM